MKKLILTLSVIFGLTLGNTFVSSFFIKDSSIKIVSKLSNNVFINSTEINSNIIILKSEGDIGKYNLFSVCNIDSKLINIYNNLYTYNLKFLDDKCSNGNIYLKNEKGDIILNTNIRLNNISDIELLTKLLDYSNDYLKKIYDSILKKKNKLKLFSNLQKDLNPKFKYLQKNRRYLEMEYILKIISNILEKRDNKYLIPVLGHHISRELNEIPNAGRPYRSSYTDGVHHGWDIIADSGTNVVALGDGIIVRVINNWKWSDFNNLNYNIKGRDDEVKNLNILRGNQVWLKTMKGDVVFYSHLSKIYSNIKEGIYVRAGTVLGKIGSTGVPDKGYTNYHLHFPIQKNPYFIYKAGKYTFLDYMKWDWYFKGKTSKYILDNQNDIFYN